MERGIYFMDYTIPENLGKELDELLTPILGNHFQIERNHHGFYFIPVMFSPFMVMNQKKGMNTKTLTTKLVNLS